MIRGITPSGNLVTLADENNAQLLQEDQVPGIPTSTTLILNRPKVLNALTDDIFNGLVNRISYIENETQIRTILLKSRGRPGRAFCAGGDVRSIAQVGREVDAGDFRRAHRLFRVEYRLNALLGALKRVVVVPLMDGIVMGGGAGLCIHGRWRVATEHTVFAMPECAIGLHPDIGVAYIFARLSIPGLGAYLALTGNRLTGMETVTVGLATHIVYSNQLAQLEKALLAQDADVKAVLDSFDVRKEETSDDKKKHSVRNGQASELRTNNSTIPGLEVMRKCFVDVSCVEDIICSLESFIGSKVEEQNNDNVEFAKQALQKLSSGSPMSLKVAWEMLKRAKKLTLNECLKLEFRLTARLICRDDFYNGVRSALVTKDHSPKWEPPTLAEISAQDVQDMFRELKDDLNIEELDLSGIVEREKDEPEPNDDAQVRPRL